MRGIPSVLLIVAIMMVIPYVGNAIAAGDEPGEYLDRRTVIWNLFFRLMVVCFTVGAVVSGIVIWQVWRFRESHPQAKPTEYEGTVW
ncbi:heme/copper-type cytochrome/quinol oxidase, subunit [Cenarchaeum symbiosum A]|uniref:Heme/copper-type cytochrome/quinol oxidase, subunit n=1 Tax=Cenarchaeum symbiosum (strain A) TaxID=414004 RepID=A0RZ17_CENSY|nr:heme/copper-type cytochrome/quinol oxidase, subunit [Cenarchaeum symbiosum A]